ncbi:uridine kinase [Kitasatospora sp. NPDC088391]|uniref:uridine kinase n=1 Tax=Kitasatospora sp. NPDC088391 TaxID=3364074 RepID=UPI0037F60657
MRVTPISQERLVELLAGRIDGLAGDDRRLRVAVDGAAAARPELLADALVEPLRLLGRPVQRVSAGGFLRPASIRFEYGKQDPDAFHDLWLDQGALLREVLDPLEPGADGRLLPSYWDPVTDRSARAGYVELPPRGVLLLDGSFLLGRWLPLELTVHLAQSPAALARRTPAAERWTLPAYERYREETDPVSLADLTVRVEDPRHPALVERP